MAESTASLQAKLKALTGGNVDIMADADTFKSTTQILREMSKEWENMTDIERASALELMGGKRQANILASLIENFDVVEDVIETSMNSQGSALAENEKYLDSMQGHLDQLSNATQTMWMNFMEEDVVKWIIDFGTEIVKLVDKVGLLNAAIATFAGVSSFKSGKMFGIFDLSKKSKAGSPTIAADTEESAAQNVDTAATERNTAATNENIAAEERSAQVSMASANADKAEAEAASTSAAADQAETASSNAESAAENAEAASSMAAAAADAAEAVSSTASANADIVEAQASMNASVADATERVSSFGAATANGAKAATDAAAAATKAASGIKILGVSLKAGSTAFKLFNAVATIGISLMVGAVISKLISLADKTHETSDEIIQKARDIKNEYESTAEGIDKSLKTIQGFESEFTRLSKCVDEHGNNISLTTEDYERYREMVASIVDMVPDVVKGYDAEGQAIINKNELIQESIDLLRRERQEAAQTFASADSWAALAQGMQEEVADVPSKETTSSNFAKTIINMIYDNIELADIVGFGSANDSGHTGLMNFMETLGYEKDIGDKITGITNNFPLGGVLANSIRPKKDINKITNELASDLPKYVQAMKDHEAEIVGTYFTQEQFDQVVDYLREYNAVDSAEQAIEQYQKEYTDLLYYAAQSMDEFWTLSTPEQNVFKKWLEAAFPIPTDGDIHSHLYAAQESMENSLRQFADSESTDEIFSDFYNLQNGVDENGSALTLDAFARQYEQFAQQLQNSGYAESMQTVFIDLLDQTELANAIEHTSAILGDDWSRALSALTTNDVLYVKYNISAEPGSMTLEELQQKITESRRETGANVVPISTYTALVEEIEKYDDMLAQTSEITSNNIKVTEDYKKELIALVGSEEAVNECFYEANPLIVKNADALNDLIKSSKETIANNVALAKSHAQLQYYELVQSLDATVGSLMAYDAESDAAAAATLEQIRVVKQSINQYRLLEDTLLGTTSAFEDFTKAKESDSKNTYGESYVEMAQTMYDALYKTGQVGSAQFWAAVEATVPDDIYKHLTPGAEQIKAIYDYLNENIMPTLTFDEDSFSIDYTAIEAFIKKAQEVGVFSGTDAKSFGISSDFLYGLAEGENALEALADRMGMTTTQVYAMLSEMDKYTTDGSGLSMMLQLDRSTSGQITYVTSQLEQLYAQRKLLLEQGANESTLGANLSEIYKYEAQLAGMQKQATDIVEDYAIVNNALADTSKTVREVLPDEIVSELQLTGDETVEEVLQQLNDYVLTLKEPTVMELEIAKQSIENELAALAEDISEEEFEANVRLNEDGLYEIKDGVLATDELTRYVELKNTQLFIDDALLNSLSTQEQLLTSINQNVAAIANGEAPPDTSTEQNTGENPSTAPESGTSGDVQSSTSGETQTSVGTQGDPQPHPSLVPGTPEYQQMRDDINLYRSIQGALQDIKDSTYKTGDRDWTGLGDFETNYQQFLSKHNYNLPIQATSWEELYDELRSKASPLLAQYGPVHFASSPYYPYYSEAGGGGAGEYGPAYDPYNPNANVKSANITVENSDLQIAGDMNAASDFYNGNSNGARIEHVIEPDGDELTDNLHESTDALDDLNNATQEATSEAEALYGVYASFEEKLATLEAIEDKTQALSADEALAFGWALAEGEILTVADAIERLKQEQDALNQTSVYNPEQYKKIELTVKTYSELQEEMSSYNEILTQTQEIVSDDIKVSKEYKDSLKELGITSQELNECFDDSNPLLVSNAKLLNKLVKNAKNNVATNIKLAKSQAQLEYYELYKEMAKLTSGTGEMTDATYDNIQSLYGQMGAVQKTIAQFSMLEAQLLGATSAYEQLEKAQAIDSANDYGSKAEELVNILGNAFNTGELGTQAAQAAIAGLIPDDVIDKAKTLDEQMQQIAEYFATGKISQLFTIEFDDDGGITSVEMTMENVQAFTEELIKADKVFHSEDGTWDEFTLDESIKSLKDFAKALGVTEEVAFAYLTKLETYDINWLGGDHETLLDQLMGDNFEYQVQKTVQQMAKLQQEKVALMTDGKETEGEQERINEINRSLEQLNGTMTSHKEAAYEAWQSYENTENALASLDKLKEASDWNETKFYELGLHELDLEWNEDTTVQEYYDQLLAKKAELGQPTELLLQLASEKTMSELDTLKAQLEEGTDIDIEANVHFNATSGEFEYTGSTEGWTEANLEKLDRYLELSGDLYDINESLGLGIDAMEGYAQRTADAVERIDQKITGNGTNDTTNTENESSVNETASTDGTGTDGTSQVNTTADTVTVVTNNATVESGETQTDLNETSDGSEAELAATQAALANMEANLSNVQSELAEAQAALGELQTELTDTQENLANTENALTQTQADLNSTESALAQAQSDLTLIESELADTQNALSRAEGELTETQNALAATQVELANKEAELTEVQGNLSSIETALAEAETNLENSEAALEAVESELAQRTAEAEDSAARLASVEAALDAKTTEAAGYAEELANAQAIIVQNDTVIAAAEAALAEANATLTETQGELAATEAALEEIRSTLTSNESALADAQSNLAKTQADLVAAEATLEAMQSALDTANDNVNALTEEKAILERTLSEQEAQLTALNERLLAAETAAASAGATIESLNVEKASLEASLADTAARLEAVNAQLDIVQSELETIEAAKTSADETIKLLNENKAALETTIAQMTSQIETLNSELIAAQESRAAAEQTITALNQENSALEANVASLTGANSALEARVAELTAQLNTTTSDGQQTSQEQTTTVSEDATTTVETRTTGNKKSWDPDEEYSFFDDVLPPGYEQDLPSEEEIEAELQLDTTNAEEQVAELNEQVDQAFTADEILAKEGLQDLPPDRILPDYDGILPRDFPGPALAFDTTIFTQVMQEAEYTEDQIASLIAKISEYENVVTTTSNPDPLGLNNANLSIEQLKNNLAELGVGGKDVLGKWMDGKRDLKINVGDVQTALRDAGWTESAIESYLQQLSNIDFGGTYRIFLDNFNYSVNDLVPGFDKVSEHVNSLINASIGDKKFEVTANGASKALKDVKDIDSYEIGDKAYEVKTTYTREYKVIGDTGTVHTSDGGGGRYTMANGTAHAQGTAHKGGSWGAKNTETALTGELGPELRVRGNRWELLGENGAEFNEVRKGDIIFNHKQTEQLLSNGYITGRGKAFAEGTVGGSAYAGINTWFDWVDDVANKYGNKGGDSKGGGGGEGGGDDAKDEFNELFDWIEVRLEEINEDINLNAAKLENAIGSTKKNAIIDNMIGLNQDLYDNLLAGANEYYRYAATLLEDVPAEYRAAAKDGKIAIEEFVGEVDEETLNAIQKYREWVQKGADVTQQAEEVLTEISNLAKQAIDNIAQDYENKSSLREGRIEQLEAHNALNETDLGFESASIYQAMIAENNRNIAILQDQRNAMLAELNRRVESGEIKRGSQDWYDAINEIAAVDTEIVNLKTDTENWQDAINDLHWEKFDSLISRLQSVSEEADNLIDILGNSDMVDEAGNWTDEGITSLGLYAQQMEAAEVEAKKYQDEIDYLNENWQKLGYTEDEYLERLGELKDGQYAAIQAYHDSKDAIVDLNKERIEAIKTIIEEEIEAYEKLIEAKKEELDAEKD